MNKRTSLCHDVIFCNDSVECSTIYTYTNWMVAILLRDQLHDHAQTIVKMVVVSLDSGHEY